MTTKIEWVRGTDGAQGESWNPVRGCSRVSPECDNCYAMRQAHRANVPGGAYEGLTVRRRGKVDWSGSVRQVHEKLTVPLRRRKATTWFVNSMSDLFHASVSSEEIAAVFGIMASCPHHTFQVLTKRAKRMRKWFEWATSAAGTNVLTGERTRIECDPLTTCLIQASRRVRLPPRIVGSGTALAWPLPNVWMGVSCGNRCDGTPRLEELRRVPAAVRFVSFEPLLEDLGELDLTGLHWAIVGSESGHGARAMRTEWARSIRDQCAAADVQFFFKQQLERGRKVSLPLLDGVRHDAMPGS